MPAFAASAVLSWPKCPRRVTLAVCACLALAPFVETGIVAANTQPVRLSKHAIAQPAVISDLPTGLGAGTATLPHPDLYVPLPHRGGAATESDAFRFHR
jgi:hypothetical protein